MTDTTAAPPLKYIGFFVERDYHRLVKERARRQRVTISDLMRDLVRQELTREEPKR